MSTDPETPAPGDQFLVQQTEDGKLKIDVRFEGETVLADAAAHGGAVSDHPVEHQPAPPEHLRRG